MTVDDVMQNPTYALTDTEASAATPTIDENNEEVIMIFLQRTNRLRLCQKNTVSKAKTK